MRPHDDFDGFDVAVNDSNSDILALSDEPWKVFGEMLTFLVFSAGPNVLASIRLIFELGFQKHVVKLTFLD